MSFFFFGIPVDYSWVLTYRCCGLFFSSLESILMNWCAVQLVTVCVLYSLWNWFSNSKSLESFTTSGRPRLFFYFEFGLTEISSSVALVSVLQLCFIQTFLFCSLQSSVVSLLCNWLAGIRQVFRYGQVVSLIQICFHVFEFDWVRLQSSVLAFIILPVAAVQCICLLIKLCFFRFRKFIVFEGRAWCKR